MYNVFIFKLAPPVEIQREEIRDPCVPSPCGPNAECRNANGVPSCSCLATYIGQPPNCRPECTINSECPSQQACINQKCRDPCPGACGFNADCHVLNHIPSCVCIDGYVGNPFTSCSPKPPERKLFKIYDWFGRPFLNVSFLIKRQLHLLWMTLAIHHRAVPMLSVIMVYVPVYPSTRETLMLNVDQNVF